MTTASMLPIPDSAETAKTTTPFRGWAAVMAAEFPARGADTINTDETNSSANSSRVQLFQNTVGSFLTLTHSLSDVSKLSARISYTATVRGPYRPRKRVGGSIQV